MQLERNTERYSMAGFKKLVGAKVNPTQKTVEISLDDLLDFLRDNWMDIPLEKRDRFCLEIQLRELGLVEPPEDEEDEAEYF